MLKNSHETITLPEFTVTVVNTQGEQQTTLPNLMAGSDKGLIIYFYPKDNTPGCTVQAVDFTANFDKLAALGYRVIGVSRDSVKSHGNFIAKQSLNIDLISDPDEVLCKHFDVIKEKMLYGKTYLGVVRSTFIYDKNAQMIGSFRNVKAKEHVDQLLEFLSN